MSRASRSSRANSSESSNFSFVSQNNENVTTPAVNRKENDEFAPRSVTFTNRNKDMNRHTERSQYATPNRRTLSAQKSPKTPNTPLLTLYEPGSSSSMVDQTTMITAVSEPSSNYSFGSSSANSPKIPRIREDTETYSPTSSFIPPISEDTEAPSTFASSRYGKSSRISPIKEDYDTQTSSKYSTYSKSSVISPIKEDSDSKSSRSSKHGKSSRISSISEDSRMHTSERSSSRSKSSEISPVKEKSSAKSSRFSSISENTKTPTIRDRTSSTASSISSSSKRSRISKIPDVDQSPISSQFVQTNTQIPSSFLHISQILNEEEEDSSSEDNTETILGNSRHEDDNNQSQTPRSRAHFASKPIYEEEEEDQPKTPHARAHFASNPIYEDDEMSSDDDYDSMEIQKHTEGSFAKPRTSFKNESEKLQDDALKSSGNEKSLYTPSLSPMIQSEDDSELSELRHKNEILLQSLVSLSRTILDSFDIDESEIEPEKFYNMDPEMIANDVEKLCAIEEHEVSQLKESAQSEEISEDVKNIVDSVSTKIRNHKMMLEKQHQELISLLK